MAPTSQRSRRHKSFRLEYQHILFGIAQSAERLAESHSENTFRSSKHGVLRLAVNQKSLVRSQGAEQFADPISVHRTHGTPHPRPKHSFRGSSDGRTPDFGSEGRRFEPCLRSKPITMPTQRPSEATMTDSRTPELHPNRLKPERNPLCRPRSTTDTW